MYTDTLLVITLVSIVVVLTLLYVQKEKYEMPLKSIYLPSPVGLASPGMPCNSQDNVKPGFYCQSGRRKTGWTPKP